ncbi:cytochrome P450 monooxygenase [Fusarium beomiforme]|uniref:Cytochrome P450 monooxygenase n=1 Tax=Fusarium beomiforme TaxID=44412 RepID=A0A9P5AKK6_9HYPO|nr:cytochrome P450 monooxygenase [Fusarium beomiforme]
MALPVLELCVAFFVAYFIYNVISVYTSPLSKIPNASFGAAFSRLLWAFPQEYNGTITLTLPELHKRLGPLIRIGPNEVSFYSRETYETVHKVGSKFKKDPRVYGHFVQGGHAALFSITDPVEHAKRRRIMGQLFARSKVSQLEKLISHHVTRFIDKIRDGDSIVDLGVASRALEADIMSDFSFGTPINAVDSWASREPLAMVEKNDEKATWMPVLTNFPLLSELLEQVEQILHTLTGFRTNYSQGLLDFQDWSRKSWQAALSAESDYGTLVTSPNLIQTLCNAGLPAETALSEAGENLGPGTDTTSATLAHIIWALAHNPSYQEALYKDLTDVSFSTDMTTLENIPRLQACVKEGIRWAAAAAAMLPRIVPPGGIELHDTFIPEGTVLASSPIWYLHDEKAYPNPKLYDPYRWLSEDGKVLTKDVLRDRFYIPFSRGANICLGAHFSYLELYISVSQIIHNYRFSPRNSSQSYAEDRSWNPVLLPERREWVAAVPVDRLEVIMYRRE